MELTNEQWNLIEPLLPPHKSQPGKRGRPAQDDRAVMNGILWILRTGAPWQDLPRKYPPYQTVHRRFQSWNESGIMHRILQELARDLEQRGGIDLSECFIDGSFSSAKKGGSKSEKPSGERAQRSWRSLTALVFLSPYAQQALRRTK